MGDGSGLPKRRRGRSAAPAESQPIDGNRGRGGSRVRKESRLVGFPSLSVAKFGGENGIETFFTFRRSVAGTGGKPGCLALSAMIAGAIGTGSVGMSRRCRNGRSATGLRIDLAALVIRLAEIISRDRKHGRQSDPGRHGVAAQKLSRLTNWHVRAFLSILTGGERTACLSLSIDRTAAGSTSIFPDPECEKKSRFDPIRHVSPGFAITRHWSGRSNYVMISPFGRKLPRARRPGQAQRSARSAPATDLVH